eukprot:1194971-Prorocentrum_minimum.AAC.7
MRESEKVSLGVWAGVDSQAFMLDLPKHLRQELAIFLNKGVMEKMAILQDCSVPFLTSILMRVRI